MTDTTTVVALPVSNSSYIEWSPIFGGAVVAAALSFVLFAFGSAAGIASVSPYSWSNPSGTTMSIVAVAFVLLVMIGTAMAGGFFAGRFRRPTDEALLSESEMRDGAHGLIVWALGMILGIVLGFMIASAGARGVASAVGSAAGTASQNVSSNQVSSAVDALMRPSAQAAPGANQQNPREVISRMMSSSTLTKGEISNDDRAYMARLVSQQAGIPEDEARRRVDSTIEQAKQAANTARKAAAILAFLLGAASIVSAGAAYWAATAGGAQRDRAIGARV